jgi:hypothetical protein
LDIGSAKLTETHAATPTNPANIFVMLLKLTVLVSTLSGYLCSTTPTQLHIALAGNDEFGNSNAMAISWQTELNTPTSQVQYGLETGKYDLSATGTSSACKNLFLNLWSHFLCEQIMRLSIITWF